MPTPNERRALADEIDRLDSEIEALQSDKKSYFASYREAHGRHECRAAQVAIKRRQKMASGKLDEIEKQEALADEVFLDIQPRMRAAREDTYGMEAQKIS